MAAVGHYGCARLTFDHISGHFRSIRNLFEIFLHNGCRRPFWMSDTQLNLFWNFWQNGCRWHLWPFQINTKFYFLFFLQNGHRRPFCMSEIHFRSHFWPFQIDIQLISKWPPADILDVRKSRLIAFLAISDWSAILDVWNSLSIAILAISDRYIFFFCDHFGCLKLTFHGISGHFKKYSGLNHVWTNILSPYPLKIILPFINDIIMDRGHI